MGRSTGGWAAALAQDLVHDAYVQFVLARPDLLKIQNLDRYLYGMLRNLEISYSKRSHAYTVELAVSRGVRLGRA